MILTFDRIGYRKQRCRKVMMEERDIALLSQHQTCVFQMWSGDVDVGNHNFLQIFVLITMWGSSGFGFFTAVGPFLFQGLNITDAAGLVGICVVMGLISFTYEGFGVLQKILLRRAQETDRSRTSLGERARLHRTITERPPPFREWIGHISLQCLLYTSQTAANYILMLSVMTYNAWLIISVVMGAVLGYFLLDPLLGDDGSQPTSIASSQCAVTNYSSTEDASSGSRTFHSTKDTHCAETVSTNWFQGRLVVLNYWRLFLVWAARVYFVGVLGTFLFSFVTARARDLIIFVYGSMKISFLWSSSPHFASFHGICHPMLTSALSELVVSYRLDKI